MGWISNFMSKAVMAGFICAMAIGIIVGQLGHLTGIHEAIGDTFQELWSVLKNISHWNWTATVLGILAIILIFGDPAVCAEGSGRPDRRGPDIDIRGGRQPEHQARQRRSPGSAVLHVPDGNLHGDLGDVA